MRNLTITELTHLIHILESWRDQGYYAGHKQQYYARTNRLIALLRYEQQCNAQTRARAK